VLRGLHSFVHPAAIVALVVMVASRALLPGLRGSVVGISDLIDAGDFVTAAASQLLAVLLLALLFGLGFELARSRAPIALRVVVPLLGGVASLAAMGAVTLQRAPLLLVSVLCFGTSTLAIVAGLDAIRRPEVGLAALCPILVGIGSLVRGIGAFVADLAGELAKDVESILGAWSFGRTLATASLGLAGLGGVAALVWLVLRARRAGVVIVAVVAVSAAMVALAASSTPDDLEAGAVVVARRAVQNLLTRPPPLGPGWLPMAAAAFAPLAATGLLAARRWVTAPVTGGLALCVVAGNSADVPLLGLGLACGALALCVYGRDPRGTFAALKRAEAAGGAARLQQRHG
jgi:hypothetical protein